MNTAVENREEPNLELEQVLNLLSMLDFRHGQLDDFLQAVAVSVSRLIRIDWSVITYSDEPGFDRILASSVNLGEAANERYQLHGTVTERVMNTGSPYWVSDCSSDAESGSMPEGYSAYLGVPLVTSRGRVVGTVCSFHREPRSFTQQAVQTATVFAHRAAMAVENFQAFQRLENFNDQLEREVKERTAELLDTQEKLIHKERLAAVGEFASMVVHDLRSPLSTIDLTLDHLCKTRLEERTARRVVIAQQEAERLGWLLDEILTFSSRTHGPEGPVEIVALATSVVERIRETHVSCRAAIEIKAPEPKLNVYGNAHKLTQLLVILLTNACEAAPTGSSVLLSIVPDVDFNNVHLSVRNATLGEKLDILRAFEPFSTTKSHGTGLGIPIAKMITEAFGGTFSLHQDEQGSVNAISLLPMLKSQQM